MPTFTRTASSTFASTRIYFLKTQVRIALRRSLNSIDENTLTKVFDTALDPIQKTLRKLEEGGLLVSFLEGKTRVFKWNPRYPFLEEIQALAKKAYSFLPTPIQKIQYQSIKRKRPRKTGKPL